MFCQRLTRASFIRLHHPVTNLPDADDRTNPALARVAAAPISWGLCEVPRWGYQLTPERVLAEMRELGLTATEFGPPGFLSVDPVERREQLDSQGLKAVGGFLAIVLHDPDHDPLPEVDEFLSGALASGGGVAVLAANTGTEGYDARPVLNEQGWQTLLANLDRAHDLAKSRGLIATLHPHMGTMIENADDVERVVAGSRIGLCVDTGHLAAAGADPVAIVLAAPDRVTHVHLKDVDNRLAVAVQQGELTFGEAVRLGMFRPLGAGDVDIAALVRALEAAAYDGWYVLEQDVKLASEPVGEGPVVDVRASLDYLLGVLS
jgi:inosose dehydratase